MLAAIAFMAGGLLAFVLVPTHEMRYYLPLGGALALAAGLSADRLTVGARFERSAWLAAFVGCGLALAAGRVRHLLEPVASTSSLLALSGVTGIVLLSVIRHRQRAVVTLAALSLLIAILQTEVFVATRAEHRARDRVAAAFDPHLPPEATIRVVGPADWAGKHASLYFYLGREVRTFEPPEGPPSGAYVILVNDQVESVGVPVEVLEQRSERAWRYVLARVRDLPTTPSM